MSRLKYDRTKRTINTLTGTRVFKEISVRTRVHQYQAFSARCSHRYFSNASRSCGGLKNDVFSSYRGEARSLEYAPTGVVNSRYD